MHKAGSAPSFPFFPIPSSREPRRNLGTSRGHGDRAGANPIPGFLFFFWGGLSDFPGWEGGNFALSRELRAKPVTHPAALLMRLNLNSCSLSASPRPDPPAGDGQRGWLWGKKGEGKKFGDPLGGC